MIVTEVVYKLESTESNEVSQRHFYFPMYVVLILLRVVYHSGDNLDRGK